MRLTTRYILSEFLKVVLLSLSGITLMVMLVIVGQQAIRQGLGPINILRLVPFALPIALQFAIPATTLFAACSVYGRVSAENEITAIKSSGVSPLAIIWPALALSFLFSLLVVGLNDLSVTWGRDGLKRVGLESVEQIVYGMLRRDRTYRSPQFSISVRGVEGHKLLSPTLTYHASEGRSFVIMAREAELTANLAKGVLSISLVDSEVEAAQSDGITMDSPGKDVIDIPLSDAAYKTDTRESPSDVPLRQVSKQVQLQQGEIQRLEESLAADAAYQLLTGDFNGLLSDQWDGRHAELAQARARLQRLRTEPWRRWANGFSCLAFVFVGAPLAVRMKNADMWTTFGLCFGVLLVVYYPLLLYGVEQAKSGDLPPYCVWLGNFVLFLLGTWLIRRASRY